MSGLKTKGYKLVILRNYVALGLHSQFCALPAVQLYNVVETVKGTSFTVKNL